MRAAISPSVNRDAMIRGLYDGAGFPLTAIVTPGVSGYDPHLPALKFDTERAMSGGNIAACLVGGWIAGRNAARARLPS